MSIKEKTHSFAMLGSIFLLCVTWGHGSFAATVEVENDDDDAIASPTPQPEISRHSETAQVEKKGPMEGLGKPESASSAHPGNGMEKKTVPADKPTEHPSVT